MRISSPPCKAPSRFKVYEFGALSRQALSRRGHARFYGVGLLVVVAVLVWAGITAPGRAVPDRR